MRLRRRRRLVGACAVTLAAALAWVHAGDGSPPEPMGAAASPTADLVGDAAHLGERLRMDAEQNLAPGAPAPGDSAIAPPPETFSEPAAPPSPPPPALKRSRFADVVPSGGTWAVMIGINDYPGSRHDLRSAVNDTTDVDEALARFGVPGNHRLLIRDRQATADTIRASVEWLTANAARDATAIFFYAGHVRKAGPGGESMVAADGGVVSDVELARLLDGLQAKKAWIGIAACYGGGFTEVLKQGRILSAAAPATSLAYENEGFGRSYFVEYMIRRAMLGSGVSTVEGAFASAQAGLSRDYPNRVPVQNDSLAGDLDLRPPKPPVPTTVTTSPPPPPEQGGGGNPTTDGGPPPPPPDDGCAKFTVGIVRCSSP